MDPAGKNTSFWTVVATQICWWTFVAALTILALYGGWAITSADPFGWHNFWYEWGMQVKLVFGFSWLVAVYRTMLQTFWTQ